MGGIEPPEQTPPRRLGRWALGGFLVVAGVGHLVAPAAFRAQVPDLLPARSAIITISGLVEIALGLGLVLLSRHRHRLGWVAAGWFVLIVPGNVWQAVAGIPAFGLDSDAARWGRLAFQPVLVVWALWSTDAWRTWRGRHRPRSR